MLSSQIVFVYEINFFFPHLNLHFYDLSINMINIVEFLFNRLYRLPLILNLLKNIFTNPTIIDSIPTPKTTKTKITPKLSFGRLRKTIASSLTP